MEASVPANGEFFWKIGQKPTDKNTSDNRALIFKERVYRGIPNETPTAGTSPDTRGVITRRGAKLLFTRGREEKIISGLNNIEREKIQFVAAGDRLAGDDGNAAYDRLTINSSSGETIDYRLLEIQSDADNALFNEAMSQSIAEARKNSKTARDRAALETEQRKLAEAKKLSGLFDTLSQPPADEVPPPAGPPPPPPPAT